MKSKNKKKILLISGPTGTGKTKLALRLAQKFDGEILSSDSRQVYIGLNYGTNKFSEAKKKWHYNTKKGIWLCKTIPVHLYDLILPTEAFSVFHFFKLATKVIKDIWSRNKLPIVVGGTGFYQRALIYPFETIGIPANPNLRSKLEKLATEELVSRLKLLSSQKARAVDLNNRRRLIRAIEVLSFKGKHPELEKLDFDCLWLGLTAAKKILYELADKWVKKISKGQVQAETKALMKKGYKYSSVMKGIVYGPTIDYLDGLLDFKQYQAQLYLQIKNYIKRQLTWFAKQPEIIWFDITDSNFETKMEKQMKTWLNSQ